MTKVPHLRLVTEGTPPVRLALTMEPQTTGSSPALVYSDRVYTFELADFGFGVFTATLFLNGETIETQPVYLDDGTLRLIPKQQFPFADFFGIIQPSLIIAKPGCTATAVYVAPVTVMLPEGEASENLKAMGDTIALSWARLIGAGSSNILSTREKRDALAEREAILDEILRVYESQYAYFRSNARFKLRLESTVDATAKLRHFSAETARFIATHPEELTEAPGGTGIRIGMRNFLPVHTLVKRNVRDHATMENEVLVGFLHTVLKGLAAEKKTVSDILGKTDDEETQYVSTGHALLGLASERLRRYCDKLAVIEDRVRETALHYRSALGIAGRSVLRIPEPTPVFLSLPPYRLIFDVMVKWFEAGDLELEAEEALIASMRQSRLYEYFVLLTLMDGLLEAGASLVESHNFRYPEGNGSGREHINTDHANTFRFVLGTRTIRLFYQPVISSAPANGISLMRTSSWSLEDGGLRPSRDCFYTPDFLIEVENEGKTDCFILDAKYSSLKSVRTYQSAPLIFRYLFSIGPAKPDTRIDGLWLFCGNALKEGEEDSALVADIQPPAGVTAMPNVHLGKVDGLNREATKNTLESLLGRVTG